MTPNIAPTGTATQSSRYTRPGFTSNFYAYLAIDENFSTNEVDCAITSHATSTWWQVDLLDVYEVSKVAITGRRDYRMCLQNNSSEIA